MIQPSAVSSCCGAGRVKCHQREDKSVTQKVVELEEALCIAGEEEQ